MEQIPDSHNFCSCPILVSAQRREKPTVVVSLVDKAVVVIVVVSVLFEWVLEVTELDVQLELELECRCGGHRVFGWCGQKHRDLDDIQVSVSLRRIRGRL